MRKHKIPPAPTVAGFSVLLPPHCPQWKEEMQALTSLLVPRPAAHPSLFLSAGAAGKDGKADPESIFTAARRLFHLSL